MGNWCHPDIRLQDLMNLIKGFVDILILASGYQSSGHFSHWDAQNIKKAFQWGIFFENVFKSLDDESVKELDAALSKLTSDPHFPQGLANISSATLSKAKSFILEHMVHTLPVRDTHLHAFLTATIEADLDELKSTENDYLHVYLDKLMLQNANFIKEGVMDISSLPNLKAKCPMKIDLTKSAIRELMKRQLAVSCVSSIETSVDILVETLTRGKSEELDNNILQEQLKYPNSVIEKQLINSITWDNWRAKNLSYLLDKRTIRLVSGASMIFSAPKVQWVQVFERLDMSCKDNANLYEIIELSLLGCVSSRWDQIIEHFMSISYQPLSISTIYQEVHNLVLERFQNPDFEEQIKNSKEYGMLEYLQVKLKDQLHHLWELHPVLTAVSLPSWSHLFKAYINELESQFKGKFTKTRCCSSVEDNKEHIECEVAERIWCLYIFHVHGSNKS